MVILCYLYNCLKKYSKTILLGSDALHSDISKDDELNIMHYMMEAYIELDKLEQT